METKADIRVLVAVNHADFDAYFVRHSEAWGAYHHDQVRNITEYEQLADKYQYDAVIVYHGAQFSQAVLNDQAVNSKRIKWVHGCTAGIDNYLMARDFANADHIVLTNSRGLFSRALAEFVALGMLFHTKRLRQFMQHQSDKEWKPHFVEMVGDKTVAIVGFGDIGAACGKVLINGFGAKVIGVKKRPDVISAEDLQCCSELVGLDRLDEVLAKADAVVAILPKTEDTVNLFNKARFGQMKKSAIFMNIGRGQTVCELDLVEALQTDTIAGAVLDVFATEPLPKDSPLWDMNNVLITPHCANTDEYMQDRVVDAMFTNLAKFATGQPLNAVCNKKLGY